MSREGPFEFSIYMPYFQVECKDSGSTAAVSARTHYVYNSSLVCRTSWYQCRLTCSPPEEERTGLHVIVQILETALFYRDLLKWSDEDYSVLATVTGDIQGTRWYLRSWSAQPIQQFFSTPICLLSLHILAHLTSYSSYLLFKDVARLRVTHPMLNLLVFVF